jgi:hypothetical protein
MGTYLGLEPVAGEAPEVFIDRLLTEIWCHVVK